MSFLSKLSQLKKSTNKNSIERKGLVGKKIRDETNTLLPKSYVREEDPAVRRLKEKRRQEMLNNGELAKKNSIKNPKSTNLSGKGTTRSNNDDKSTEFKFKRKLGTNTTMTSNQGGLKRKPEPIKKISFEELMKQAETNANNPIKGANKSDGSKISIIRKEMPRPHITKPGFKPQRSSHRNELLRHNKSNSEFALNSSSEPNKEMKPVVVHLPKVGFAKPNQRIRERIQSKKRDYHSYDDHHYEDDDDMDDFIDDDIEFEDQSHTKSQRNGGYNRDEIWAMFSRGKSRSAYTRNDYEDYDDDMEANEMEIMDEEEEAERMGKLEDKREQLWLKRHEEEKRCLKSSK